MTRAALLLAALLLAACGDDLAAPPQLDADPVVHQIDGAPGGDLFGESCAEAPYPAVTLCRGHEGWCVPDGNAGGDVCRPQCQPSPGGKAFCPAGTPKLTDRGACYCGA